MPCNNQSTDKIPTINYSKQNLPKDQTFFFPQYMLTSQIEEKKNLEILKKSRSTKSWEIFGKF